MECGRTSERLLLKNSNVPVAESAPSRLAVVDPERSLMLSHNGRSSSEIGDLFGQSREACVRVHVHQGASENEANSAVSTFPF